MKTARSAALGALAALVLLGPMQMADAQTWPSRPLHWIVPIPPGGGPDVVARIVAPALAERLGQPVVVENLPGGAHNIAMQAVARSAPDGHTLLLALTSLVTNPHLYALDFNPALDLAPVARIASSEWVLVARPSLPVQSLEELLAYARANRTSCAITGGMTEIACRMLAAVSGTALVQVPYRGGPQVFNDMMGGHVDLRIAEASVAEPLVGAGRLRAIASLNPRRGSGAFANLPTLAETWPGFEFVTWQGVLVRTGTPPEVLARLAGELEAVLSSKEVSQAIRATGNVPSFAGPRAFEAVIQRDLERYGKLIRDLGIRAEP